MRCLTTLLFLFIISPFLNAQDWTFKADTVVSFSSPRPADLNGDGIDDIVMGCGVEQLNRISIVAIDGKTGKELWSHRANDEFFGSAIFQDIDNDQI
ncbi:MAG: PQQ-binding-like beta-propeller repeat protein, partial [Bacteroidetes bacterium]|nr:PQQ-binding-like beta-propeller repeat protein [Bacteroidota bacterium]